MVGKELDLRKEGPVDLREIAANTTLREVRQKGHTYVELRRDGKRIIFFCTICLTPCYSDAVLFDHLKGNLHTRMYAAAEATLIGPVPWPFNDGVLFFGNSHQNEIEKDKDPAMLDTGSQSKALVVHSQGEVSFRIKDGSKHGKSRHKNLKLAISGRSRALSYNESDDSFIIPSVLLKEVVSNLKVQLMGFGDVSYRISQKDESPGKITKIWCAWMDKEQDNFHDEVAMTQKCYFAVVNFGYTYDLGRKCGSDEVEPVLSAGSYFMIDDAGQRGIKRKLFSDQEASSVESNEQISPEKRDGESSRQLVSIFPSKSARRELRKQKRMAVDRACDICGQTMLNGKDVGALFNCKTGFLACSSRNANGVSSKALTHFFCFVQIVVAIYS
jgi:Zinc-finger of C2H2 type